MLDLRNVGYLIGLLSSALGLTMLAPLLADLWTGAQTPLAFGLSALLAVSIGGLLTFACRRRDEAGLTVREAFLLTTSAWALLPLVACPPFMLGETQTSFADAYFEAMSGLSTTGATVLSGLDTMAPGLLLWRAMLQWFGGVGIIVVALAFLPAMRVGGMQLFKSESFDTFGKILPRAGEIATSISALYVGLTLICAVVYASLGMSLFDAACHAMSTIATGGFSNSDSSMGAYSAMHEYAATFFMLVASLPLVRLVQLAGGDPGALWRDSQARAFLGFAAALVALIVAWRLLNGAQDLEEVLRRSAFNAVSVLTGTGFASEDYSLWGPLPIMALFIAGFIGGCSGSATCAIKVFRFQVAAAAIIAQIRQIHSPSSIAIPRYDGHPINSEVLTSVLSVFYFFALSLALIAIMLSMAGLDSVTAISGAATMLSNIGPGFGEIIGPAGNFAPLSDLAKWICSGAMLLGRLEILSVIVIFTTAFWRA